MKHGGNQSAALSKAAGEKSAELKIREGEQSQATQPAGSPIHLRHRLQSGSAQQDPFPVCPLT